MKKCLFVDCTLRPNSRTKMIADALINNLQDYDIKHLKLDELDLKPLTKDFYWDREKLLANKQFNHPRFKYANEIKEANLVVIAAPFWDMSFPSLLKIYIENICVEGITFNTTDKGMQGLCIADNLVFITTRGGYCANTDFEQATPYLKMLCPFLGFKKFTCIDAEGLNDSSHTSYEQLDDAIDKAKLLAKEL